MDVSELRKGILRALDEARKDTAARKQHVDQAAAAYGRFLSMAAPLFLQTAMVLRSEGQHFSANTPADSVRLVSDRASQDFIEVVLDVSTAPPRVIGRTSLGRGGKGLVVDEQPLAGGKAIEELTEEDVSTFLLNEVRRLLTRT